MRGYDSHLILKGDEHSVSLKSNISVIPSNTEQFIAFQLGKLRFLDSLQFLNASLDKLVNTLPADAFKFTSKFSPSPDLVKQKQIFPYEYMTDQTDPSSMNSSSLQKKSFTALSRRVT